MIPNTINWHGNEAQVFQALDQQKLNELFLDYINYGGYPANTLKSIFPHSLT